MESMTYLYLCTKAPILRLPRLAFMQAGREVQDRAGLLE